MLRTLVVFGFLATASFVSAQGATPADDNRLQSIIDRQSSAIVRVKASVEDRPIVSDDSQKTKTEEAGSQTLSNDRRESVEGQDGKTTQTAQPKVFLRLGTGFFVSPDGIIITNASVVDGAKRVWYEVEGVAYLAEVKGIDAPTNIAILQAKTRPQSFTTINLADNVTSPKIGDSLLRLSLPMEFGMTPTVGIMQGADTQFGARPFPTRYLRAQLNTGPGEAGAPVFDLQGRFVGITVAVIPELGATYVLPARALNWVRENMTPTGRSYSYFGFNVDEARSAANGTQLVVKNVDENGPAASSHLKVGDIVVSAADKATSSLADLRDAVFYTKPGQYLDLRVQRGNSTTAISIQAQEKK